MSRTMGVSFPGTATAIGLVDSSMSIPPQGAMWLALPTARYSPIMSCSSGIAAYSDAGPAWLLRLTPTQATPAVFAFSIAVFAAKLITTCPMPLSPSTSAIPAASRATRTFGFTLTAPPRILRTYCCRRKIPWPSAPWRSARTISSAQVAASLAGRPTATSASTVKCLRRVAGRRVEGVVGAVSDFTEMRSGGRDMPHPTMRAKAQQRSRSARYDSFSVRWSNLEEDESCVCRTRPLLPHAAGFRSAAGEAGRRPHHRALRKRGRHLRRGEPGLHHPAADRGAADAAAGRSARVRARRDHHPAQRRRQGEPVLPARLQSGPRHRLPHHDQPHAGEHADARARAGLFRSQLPHP